jgi:predicted acylesterase/phospholipase RssA
MLSTLVLSGGSLNCIAYIGAVKCLQEYNLLESIKTFIGTSIGALISFLLCIGFTWFEIEQSLYEFISMQNDAEPNVDNILNLFFSLGVDSGDVVIEFLKKQLQKKLKLDDITFLEFAKRTGCNLVVTACKVSSMDIVYFSFENTPHLSVLTGIRASVSLPVIFTPVNIDNVLYIDAGIVLNFPASYIKDNCIKDVLGICITSQSIVNESPDINLAEMLLSIIDNSIRKLNSTVPIPSNIHYVQVPLGTLKALEINYDVKQMKFEISNEDVKEKIRLGYNVMESYYKEKLCLHKLQT